MIESTQESDFLWALLSMEKTYSNVWDSAHGLFWIQENQFCTNKKKAIRFLQAIQDDYNILQIWEETKFSYEDTYMDSLKFCLFDENQASDKPHISVRSRSNITSDSTTFQIVHTLNSRKSIYHYTPSQDTTLLSNENITFFNGMYNSLTGKNATFLPIPVIKTRFTRVILYSKSRAERVNIDFNISHTHIKSWLWKPKKFKNLVIIETKSLDWTSHNILKVLKKLWIKKINHTSKFLIWMNELYDLPLKWKHKKYAKRIKNI